jgi:hypothetical protein
MKDPGHSVVELNALSRKLTALTAVSINPDIEGILVAATEIREHAQFVRMWAFEKMNEVKPHERSKQDT